MKKIILFFFLIIGFRAYSQKPEEEYAFQTDLTSIVEEWDDNTQNVCMPKIVYRVLYGSRFILKEHVTSKIDSKETPGWRITFVPFKKAGKISSGVTVIGKEQNDKSFFISDAEITTRATKDFPKPFSVVNLSAVVLPIKLRFKNDSPGSAFDLTQSINIGAVICATKNLGGTFGNSSISGLGGLNITNVSVDEKTVPTVITSKTTLLGISPVAGLNYVYKGIGFGIMTGMDFLMGEAGDKWVYKGKLWVGLSIGTSLVTLVGKKTEQ